MAMKILPERIMYPEDPIYNKLTQEQIDRIYWEKFKIAEKLNPEIIVEIGVRTGYSAYAFLSAVPQALYFGFDCCDSRQAGGKEYLEHAERILNPYKAVVLRKDSFTLKTLGLELVDLVSVDGNHTYPYAYHDLELAFHALRDGGYILVDDTSYIPSVKRAVANFYTEYNLSKEQVIVEKDVKGIRGYMLLRVKK